MTRLQDFYDGLETLNNAAMSISYSSAGLSHDIEKTYYLGVIAKQLCEITDILIEYKEAKNDNK